MQFGLAEEATVFGGDSRFQHPHLELGEQLPVGGVQMNHPIDGAFGSQHNLIQIRDFAGQIVLLHKMVHERGLRSVDETGLVPHLDDTFLRGKPHTIRIPFALHFLLVKSANIRTGRRLRKGLAQN